MLTSAKALLDDAQAKGYAIGAFNTYNLELTLGIIRAAETLNAPIYLQAGASALAYGGHEPLAAMMISAAKNASIPIAVHLDHARDPETLQDCAAWGFSSVMFDGSNLRFSENVIRTREAASTAHNAQIPIEGELGAMAGQEDGATEYADTLPTTDPDQAADYVARTGIDSLAIAIGNRHGYYKGEPRLDFERLSQIRALVEVPLVLHGASGIPDDAIRRAVAGGISKINVNTDMRYAFFETLQNKLPDGASSGFNLPQIMSPAIDAVQRVVEDKIRLFGSVNRA